MRIAQMNGGGGSFGITGTSAGIAAGITEPVYVPTPTKTTWYSPTPEPTPEPVYVPEPVYTAPSIPRWKFIPPEPTPEPKEIIADVIETVDKIPEAIAAAVTHTEVGAAPTIPTEEFGSMGVTGLTAGITARMPTGELDLSFLGIKETIPVLPPELAPSISQEIWEQATGRPISEGWEVLPEEYKPYIPKPDVWATRQEDIFGYPGLAESDPVARIIAETPVYDTFHEITTGTPYHEEGVKMPELPGWPDIPWDKIILAIVLIIVIIFVGALAAGKVM